MPERIQRKRTRGWKMPTGVVYVGRPTRYGNPFKVGQKVEDPDVPNGYIIINEVDCLEFFENYVRGELMDDEDWLKPLQGKDLACWCPLSGPCHVDVLLKLIREWYGLSVPAPPSP